MLSPIQQNTYSSSEIHDAETQLACMWHETVRSLIGKDAHFYLQQRAQLIKENLLLFQNYQRVRQEITSLAEPTAKKADLEQASQELANKILKNQNTIDQLLVKVGVVLKINRVFMNSFINFLRG